jgi:hypothetical protein
MKGKKRCSKCRKTFEWIRSSNQAIPRFCSLECRGHTGFIPGGSIRLKELTVKEKLERLKKSFNERVIKQPNCWGWNGPVDQGGYPVMGCRRQCGSDRGHRASWIIHYGKIPKGMHICHACDNPICTNPDHLWVGTHKQNNDDKIAKNRQAKNTPPHKPGILNGSAKLKEEQVREIKILIASGRSCYSLGKEFAVSKQTILRIKNGKNWSNIEV